jgi:hypothetical protein
MQEGLAMGQPQMHSSEKADDGLLLMAANELCRRDGAPGDLFMLG